MRRAAEFILLGEAFDAAVARELGLVNAIVEPGELYAHALAKAQALAAKPRDALLATRRLLRGDPAPLKARMDEEMRLFGEAVRSPQARAAFMAFMQKVEGVKSQNQGRRRMSAQSLKGKTLFITGASRGIGLAIGLRAARDGANIAIAAKTSEANAKLPGTIHTAAAEIEAAGGRALPLVVDVRDEAAVRGALDETAAHFGGIDIVVNNASAISLTNSQATEMKRFDLMHQINARGTFMVSKFAVPYLAKSANPHILMLSPPLDMKEKWFAGHTAYTMAKFGMSLVVLGLAGELRAKGIAVNALWPRTHDRHRRRQESARRRGADARLAQAGNPRRRRAYRLLQGRQELHRAVS